MLKTSAWESLQADTVREFGKYTLRGLIVGALTQRTFRVVVTMRMCQMFQNRSRIALAFCQCLHHWSTNAAAMDFSWRTSVDAGLALTHGWGLVVNKDARIGRNVTLFHGVTLGQTDRISADGQRDSSFPVIEDEVWIGPNAVVVGGIVIGRGSRVAPGSYVTISVPAYSIVAGNPATIVKTGCVPDVTNPAQ